MADTKSSRRDFLRQVGTAAGAAAVASPALDGPAFAQAPTPAAIPILPDSVPASPFPALNRRTLGWLRFLWEKATTPDDWSSTGVPHMWWDRYSNPVVTSYGRFDLHNSAYALLLMADQTPAWREVYTRVADGLVSRYPTYWGAIDWLTQIGDDPKRANYPPRIMDQNQIPERLHGKYNRYGWTANGVEPWGLQPDPVGADGNLFFRGWFTLTLAIYQYIAGDGKWAQPFNVTGYADEQFEWDQHRIAERLASQYRDRPEGPQCENTKIWFSCNSAAGLGMYLYDKVYGRQTHAAFQNFLEYARENYMGVSSDGRLEWVTRYYDPIAGFKSNRSGSLGPAFLLLPQHREMAELMYETAANASGWRNPGVPVQENATALIMARELGDSVAVARLRDAAEREYNPRFFGEYQEKFGWWFDFNEAYPRGQRSASMMVAEVGRGGEWLRAFEAPHMNKFTAPTVEGIDFPALGVYQAWNDPDGGALFVGTYAASPDRQGVSTSWRVTNLPNAADVFILCDGEPFDRFEVTGPNTIRLDATIDHHRYQIFTGYRGTETPANAAREQHQGQVAAGLVVAQRPAGGDARAVRSTDRNLFSPAEAVCPCCQA